MYAQPNTILSVLRSVVTISTLVIQNNRGSTLKDKGSPGRLFLRSRAEAVSPFPHSVYGAYQLVHGGS